MKYCIFVERIFDDECFKALKEFCKKHYGKVKLFCLTPANYNLVCAEQGYTGTKEKLGRIMADRYRQLMSLANIDLHIHLGLRLENIDQKNLFKEAMHWMKYNGFTPELWTAGWYIYDGISILEARQYGLEYFKDKWHFSFHDYEWDKKFSLMMIITNMRGILRK